MLNDSYYGPQAYRAVSLTDKELEALHRQYVPPKSLRPGVLNRGQFLKRLTLFEKAPEIIPQNIFIARTPQMLRQEEKKPQKMLLHDLYSEWNETSICFRKPSFLYNNLSFLIYFSLLILAIVMIITLLLNARAINVLTVWGYNIFFLIGLSLILVCAACWLLRKMLPHNGLGYIYELNRRTGLINKFSYSWVLPHKKPKLSSIAFSEIEGIICKRTQKYSYYYDLLLQHGFSRSQFKLNDDFCIYLAAENIIIQYWYFFQNYMDVSKPLPDIPLFEKCRSKDPTTAEHDLRNKRKLRYWAGMSDSHWAKSCLDNPF